MSDHKIDLSVIIAAHAEGIILHKTIKSVMKALDSLRGRYNFEVLLNLDSPSEATGRYVDLYRNTLLKDVHIFRESFGDVGLVRNFLVSKSKGKFVAVVDGDDLYSATIYANALEVLNKQNDVVVHPRYIVSFDAEFLIDEKLDTTTSFTIDTLRLLHTNIWGSCAIASRDTFLSYSYRTNSVAFGFEDMHFYCETISAGIKHVVTDDIFFYRRKQSGSMLADQFANKAVLTKTSLFDFDRLRNLGENKISNEDQLLMKKFNEDEEPDISRLLMGFTKFPDWFVNELSNIHAIEPKITTNRWELAKTSLYKGDKTVKPGLAYVALLRSMSRKPDTLFLVPWLVKGGADRVFMNYADELTKINKDWNIAFFQTYDNVASVWAKNLSSKIDFINFAEIMKDFDNDYRLKQLAQFIVQNDIKRLFIANSAVGFELVDRYRPLIKELDVKVYTFAFCEPVKPSDRKTSYVHGQIPLIYDMVERIITDNQHVVDVMAAVHGLDASKFSVQYQPSSIIARKPSLRNAGDKKLRILWASRICRQKRPDILMAIARKLDVSKFTIDVYGAFEDGYTSKFFEAKNVKYMGEYSGMDDLPVRDYDIFLYTSESDGVPNVLQEATALGLPIVASDSGGVSEFIIDGVTGILAGTEDTSDYIDAIHKLAANPDKRLSLVLAAQNHMADHFSAGAWRKEVARSVS